MSAAEPIFRPYIFPEDPDVMFIGVDWWHDRVSDRPGEVRRSTPLLKGYYVVNEKEIDALIDEAVADLERTRRAAKKMLPKLKI